MSHYSNEQFEFTYHVPYKNDIDEKEVDKKLIGSGSFDIQTIMCCFIAYFKWLDIMDAKNVLEIFVYHKFPNNALMMNIVGTNPYRGYVKAISHKLCDAILGENIQKVKVRNIAMDAFVHDNVYYIDSKTFVTKLLEVSFV